MRRGYESAHRPYHVATGITNPGRDYPPWAFVLSVRKSPLVAQEVERAAEYSTARSESV